MTKNFSAWDKVQIARQSDRPSSLDVIESLMDDFLEMHAGRNYKDDGAIVSGIAFFEGMPVTVIAIVKGRDLEENQIRNYGMVHPEGYRKALRMMQQAEKFKRPIITLIDTPGAYPGIGAEERGQGEAIAQNLYAMSQLKVPIISIILGEAGSGGALALAMGNKVWMMEHAIYSILSPEGFASILYKDASKAKDVVDTMKITAQDLMGMKIIDVIIPEGEDLSRNFDAVMSHLRVSLKKELMDYRKMNPKAIMKERQKRFRNMGEVRYDK